MNENNLVAVSPDCLGWCPESPLARVLFLDRSFDADRPKRVYEDRIWWCPSCWKDDVTTEDGSAEAKEKFRRFHLVYEPNLRSFVRRRAINHFPAPLVPDVAEDVISETMATVWRCWTRLDTPEHVMFRIAERQLMRRMPKQKKLAFIPFGEEDDLPEIQRTSVTEPDPFDEIEEMLALEQMIEELPEPQRSYARARRHGASLDDIAASHGRTKGTISVGLKKAADVMRPLADIITLMINIVQIIRFVSPALIALIAALLALLL